MALGYACICIGDYKRLRGLRLSNASEKKLDEVYAHNLDVLKSNIEYNIRHDIHLFRISSEIFPLITHEEVDYDWKRKFSSELDDIKKLITSANIRVSMHPGQYTVLNSIRDDVVKKAIIEIDHHSEFLSAVSDDERSPIVIHIGSKAKNKDAAIKNFIYNFKKLSDASKNRLHIENDERSYTAQDIYDISCDIGIPCIFDNLHNRLNRSYDLSDREIISIFSKTFSGSKQKIHYSEQAPDKKPGAHSKTIDHKRFGKYYSEVNGDKLDIMLEVKDKDLSCVKCSNYLFGEKKEAYDEWARYKYFVMERGLGFYQEIGRMFSEDIFTYEKFYHILDEAVKTAPDKGNTINALMHVWGYFKKAASETEKQKYMRYLDKIQKSSSAIPAKNFLLKLAIKHNIDYLKNSIYFKSYIYK